MFFTGWFNSPTASPRLLQREMVTPAHLRARIFTWFVRRRPSVVIGPPGVGKTISAKIAAQEAFAQGKIKTWEIVTGNKDLLPEHLFDGQIVISDKSEKFVSLKPSLIRKHVEGSLRPVTSMTSQEAIRSWRDDEWLALILDESTRCTPYFMDSILPLLNDFQVTIEEGTFYAPVVVILLGNAPGMDASTVVFSHAVTSRLFERVTMLQPGPETLAMIYTIPNIREEADRRGIPPHCRPTEDHARLACGVITLLWGLPLSRKGMACLDDEAHAFIRAVEGRDAELTDLLIELGRLTHFGPDPRKGYRWLTTAMELAADEGVAFSVTHLAKTALQCLSVAGKTTFSEGQEPHKQQLYEALVKEIAGRALRMPWLLDLVRPHTVPVVGPGVEAKVAKAFFTDSCGREEAIGRLLAAHRGRLADDGVADREARATAVSTFLERICTLDATLPNAELAVAVRRIASRIDGEILSADGFRAAADRELLIEIGELGGLSPLAEAVVALARNGMAATPLTIDEEIRLACRTARHAADFEPELLACVRAHPEVRGRVVVAAEALHELIALPKGADVENVHARLVTSLGSEGYTTARPFLRELCGAVALAAKRGFVERFQQLKERMS
jgi:hypothetical protein